MVQAHSADGAVELGLDAAGIVFVADAAHHLVAGVLGCGVLAHVEELVGPHQIGVGMLEVGRSLGSCGEQHGSEAHRGQEADGDNLGKVHHQGIKVAGTVGGHRSFGGVLIHARVFT